MDKHDAELNQRSTSRRAVQRVEQPNHDPGMAQVHVMPTPSISLLGAPAMRGRGNSSVQIAMMQRMQSTYGNRATQRLVQRATRAHVPPTLPVQRCGATPCNCPIEKKPAAAKEAPMQGDTTPERGQSQAIAHEAGSMVQRSGEGATVQRVFGLPDLRSIRRQISELKRQAEALTHHGNWCGPGTNGQPPVDALDKCCKRHDEDYAAANIGAGASMWTPKGLRKAMVPDLRLVGCSTAIMPWRLSARALAYREGVKTIFGARAALASQIPAIVSWF